MSPCSEIFLLAYQSYCTNTEAPQELILPPIETLTLGDGWDVTEARNPYISYYVYL